MRWAGRVVRKGERRNAYRVSVGKPEGKKPLVRPRHRWENVDWNHLAKVRVLWRAFVNTVMNIRIPENRKFFD
jgi:hypothetical protein